MFVLTGERRGCLFDVEQPGVRERSKLERFRSLPLARRIEHPRTFHPILLRGSLRCSSEVGSRGGGAKQPDDEGSGQRSGAGSRRAVGGYAYLVDVYVPRYEQDRLVVVHVADLTEVSVRSGGGSWTKAASRTRRWTE